MSCHLTGSNRTTASVEEGREGRYLIPDGRVLRGPVSVGVALSGDGRGSRIYVNRPHRCGLTKGFGGQPGSARSWQTLGFFICALAYSQSACRPSRRCSRRCSLSAQTARWTECAGTRSRAFQRSPSASRIAGRWPSPLHDNGETNRFSVGATVSLVHMFWGWGSFHKHKINKPATSMFLNWWVAELFILGSSFIGFLV